MTRFLRNLAPLALALAAAFPAACDPVESNEVAGGKVNRLPADDGDAGATTVFAVYADPHAVTPIHQRVCWGILGFSPDFAVLGGDCVYNDVHDDEWSDFLEGSALLRETVPLLPVRGRHEGVEKFLSVFATPNGLSYYSADYRNLHLVAADTDLPMDPASPQGQWLAADLAAAASRPFTIVFHHQPVISSGNDFATGGRAALAHLNPLLLAHGADLSLCGHEHFYERLEQDGLTYMVVPPSGGEPRSRALDHPASRRFARSFGFCVVRALPGALEVEAWGLDGRLLDRFQVLPR